MVNSLINNIVIYYLWETLTNNIVQFYSTELDKIFLNIRVNEI